ncbi:MAG: LapA family protein [Patescibacteria group bacterium]
MLTWIAYIISGIVVAIFAIQNTQLVEVSLVFRSWQNVPLYLVVVFTFLIGVSMSWLITFIGSIPTKFKLRGKNKKLKSVKEELVLLTREIHQLELENESLRKKVKVVDEKSL